MKRSKRTQVTVGTALPAILEQLGVEVVFGIPGNHTVELYRGLASTGIRHITTRHEQGAAFMADGYARVQRKPGVCFLISGPGLLNAATAITQAHRDGVPLLVITTCGDTNSNNTGLHEMPDQSRVAQGLGKGHFKLQDPAQLSDTVSKAYALSLSPSPGAVILEVGVGLLGQTLSHLPETKPLQQRRKKLTTNQQTQLVSRLSNAKRPLLLLGGGAQWCAPQELISLAQRLDTPVLNTVNGKGIVPAGHPLAVGGSPSLASLKRALAKADVVLTLGTELAETDYDLLMNNTPPPQGSWLHINTGALAVEDNRHHQIFRVSVAEAASVLLNHAPQTRRRGAQRAQRLRQQVQQEHHYHPDFARVFNAIQQAAEDLILVGDSTRPTYYAAWMYECRAPGRYFHSASGFGTLGYAIPAALGASVSSRIPVIALIGDGGAQFTLTELATAIDNHLNVPIIIWRNQGYEEITNSLKARGVGASSTLVSAPDYRKIAHAYNIPCFSPRSVEGLTRAIRQTLKLNKPGLILIDQHRFVHSPSGEWYG